ncbi:MAG: hypothetical protein ACYC1D_15885 [Acidimicrobiales bacterium]
MPGGRVAAGLVALECAGVVVCGAGTTIVGGRVVVVVAGGGTVVGAGPSRLGRVMGLGGGDVAASAGAADSPTRTTAVTTRERRVEREREWERRANVWKFDDGQALTCGGLATSSPSR